MIDTEIINFLNCLLVLFVVNHFSFYYTGYYLLNKLLKVNLDLNYSSTIIVGFSVFGLLSFFAYLFNINLNLFILVIFLIVFFCIIRLKEILFDKKIFYSILSSFLTISLLLNIFPNFSIGTFENNYSSDFWSYMANSVMLAESKLVRIRIPQFVNELKYSYTPFNPYILYISLLKKITNENILHLWQAINIYNIFLYLGVLYSLCKKIFLQNKLLIIIFFGIYYVIIDYNYAHFGLSKEIFKYFNYPRNILFISLLFLNILFFQFYQIKKNNHHLIILIIFFTLSLHPQSIILVLINFFIWFFIFFKKNDLTYFNKDILIFLSILFFSIIWYLVVKTYVPQSYFNYLGISLVENYPEYKKIFNNFYIFNLNIFLNQKYNFLFLILFYITFFIYLFQKKNIEKKFIIFIFIQTNIIFLILLNPLVLNMLWKYIPPFATTRLIGMTFLPEFISMCAVFYLRVKITESFSLDKKLESMFDYIQKLKSILVIAIITFILLFIFDKNKDFQKNDSYTELIEFIEERIPKKSILVSDENTSVQLNSFKYIHILDSREHYLQIFKDDHKNYKIIADEILLSKNLEILKKMEIDKKSKIFIVVNKKFSGEVSQDEFNLNSFYLKTLLNNSSYKIMEIKNEK